MAAKDVCTLCGRQIRNRIVERIEDVNYVFDREECVLVFKKLKSVYGTAFDFT